MTDYQSPYIIPGIGLDETLIIRMITTEFGLPDETNLKRQTK
jgi:hypothetical protein